MSTSVLYISKFFSSEILVHMFFCEIDIGSCDLLEIKMLYGCCV